MSTKTRISTNNNLNFLYLSILTFLLYSFIIIISAIYILFILTTNFNDDLSSSAINPHWTEPIFYLFSHIPVNLNHQILTLYSSCIPKFLGILVIIIFFIRFAFKIKDKKIILTLQNIFLIILASCSIILYSTSMFLFSDFITNNTIYANIIKNNKEDKLAIANESSWQNGIIYGVDVNTKEDITTLSTKISQYNIRNIFIPRALVQRMNKNGPTLWNSFIEMLKQAKKEYHVKVYVDLEAYFYDQVGFEFPPQAVLSMAFTPEEVYLMSRQYGEALKKNMLVDFVLGPVLDRKISPKDSLIEARSFSNNYEKIYIYASAMIAGFHDAGIVCIAKHFPGHPQIEESSNNSHIRSFSFYSDQEIKNSSAIYRKLYEKKQIELRAILPDPVIIPAIDKERPFTISNNGVSDFLKRPTVYGDDKLKKTLVVSDAITMVMGKYRDSTEMVSLDNEDPRFMQEMCTSTIDILNAGHDLVLTQEVKPKKIDEFQKCLAKNQEKIAKKQNSGDSKAAKLLSSVRNSAYQAPITEPNNVAELFQRGYALRLSSENFAHKSHISMSKKAKSILLLSTCYLKDDVYIALQNIFASSSIDYVIYKRATKTHEIYLPSKGDKQTAAYKELPQAYTTDLSSTIKSYDLVILSFANYDDYFNSTKNYLSTIIADSETHGNSDSELLGKIMIVCATHPEFYYEDKIRVDYLKALNNFSSYTVFRNSNNLTNSMKQIICDMADSPTQWNFCDNSKINTVNDYEINLPDYYYVNRLSQKVPFTPDKRYPDLYKRFLGTLGDNIYQIHAHIQFLTKAFAILAFLTATLFSSNYVYNSYKKKQKKRAP